MADPYQWASPESLVEKGYPADVVDRAVFSASWALWALSGRKLHGEGTRVDTWEMRPGGRPHLKLRYTPVVSVTKVEMFSPWTPDSIAEVTNYGRVGTTIQLDRAVGVLAPLAANVPMGGVPGTWVTPRNMGPIDTAGDSTIARVTYVVASNLPPQTHFVVLALAEEYCKAATGVGCNLPQRVTSITRGGMTWTMLDPGDFLDKQLTGMIPIDSWLTAVNPTHARQPSRVFVATDPRLIESHWARVPTSKVANGDGTFTHFGHGSPLIIDLSAAVNGDSYVDLDTGKTYAGVTP